MFKNTSIKIDDLIRICIIVSNQDSKKIIKEGEGVNLIDLYVRALEPNTKLSISGNYKINNYLSNIELGGGRFSSDSYTFVGKVIANKTRIYCSSEGYYSDSLAKEFSLFEISTNVSKVDCILNRVGKISGDTSKNLVEGENKIPIKLSVIGIVNKPTICVSWTPGIVSVQKEDKNLICNNSIWLNYSSILYDKKNKPIYTWLENGKYGCGENWIVDCDSAYSNVCIPKEISVPSRYKNKVDKCFIIDEELENVEKTININIKTKSLSNFQ